MQSLAFSSCGFMQHPGKERIDTLLVDRGFVQSRERAKALIMEGKVAVRDKIVDKPGINIETDAEIQIRGEDLPS